MRDLQECQAEVFRRSEERIKARNRRRNRILTTCIPLLLCLVILGAAMLPGNPTADLAVPESGREPDSTAPVYGMGIDGMTGAPEGALSGAVNEPEDAGEYGVQCIRTDVQQDVQLPYAAVIRSREELEQYHRKNKDFFDLAGFWDVCDKYDNGYFEKGCVILVALEESSGSIRHEFVGSTYSSDGKLCIYLESVVPEVGTCDMAGWHILVEMRNVLQIGDKDVQVKLDGKQLIG